MQKELDEAAAAGYRILCGAPTSGTEIALILESVATPPDTYEYLLLATSKTSTMQKEMMEATEGGYQVVGMVSRDEHIVILERPAPAPGD